MNNNMDAGERDMLREYELIAQWAHNTPHYGRADDYTHSAQIKGPCGDSMEFYVTIKDNHIEKISFYTDGCISTRACGSVAAQYVLGKSVDDALGLSPKMILDELKELPGRFNHCAILAVNTFFKAVAEYLLRR